MGCQFVDGCRTWRVVVVIVGRDVVLGLIRGKAAKMQLGNALSVVKVGQG